LFQGYQNLAAIGQVDLIDLPMQAAADYSYLSSRIIGRAHDMRNQIVAGDYLLYILGKRVPKLILAVVTSYVIVQITTVEFVCHSPLLLSGKSA
jgi:hypothetical protein